MSRSHQFVSVPSHETQSIYNSNDDILLQNQKQPIQETTTYINTPFDPSSSSHYNPIPKPRPAPTHHFWKSTSPGLGIVVFIGDVLLTLAPCLFLVLAFQALSVNRKAINDHGGTVEQAAKLGPTLFPIIFAAVVGRLMRTLALWKAERGAPLGILEQLNGSQNLLAAFERAVLLPGLGILSIAVVFLWALSPLGGQSSLRVLSRYDASTFNTSDVYYFNNSGNPVGSGAFLGASALGSGGTTLGGILQGALLSIERVKGQDLWGNVKIPFLEQVPSYQANDEDNGWCDFTENNYTAPYSAMIGIVVSGLQSNTDTNLTLESSYFNLSCPAPQFFPMNMSADIPAFFGGFWEWATIPEPMWIHDNASQLFYQSSSSTGLQTNSYIIDTNWNASTAMPDRSFNVIYASQGAEQTEVAAYNCTMGVTHVESDVYCKGTSCLVRRIRKSKKVTWPDPTAGWPFNSESNTLPYNMLSWLSTAISPSHSAMVSPIDWFVSGSDTPFQLDYTSDADVSYRNVSGEMLALRLGNLINTAYQASFALGATAQPPSQNITALKLGLNDTTARQGVGYSTTYQLATTIETQQRFLANIAWVAVTVIVAFILLFCGLISMIFKYGTRSPDILGFVSSMTRDNPNFEHIPGGDKLDGLQRARVLRHIRVQITDVKPWDEDGHVTLRNLGHSKHP